MRRLIGIVWIVCCCAAPALAGPPARDPFAVPPGLEDEVRFWQAVFGRFGADQVVFYDERYLNVIYKVLDFSALSARRDISRAAKREIRQTEVNRTVREIAAALNGLAPCGACAEATDEQRYYRKLFAGVPAPDAPRALAGAVSRIRVQIGQKDYLRRAIVQSIPYAGDIRHLFETRRLPPDLIALVFIESMFNPRALSKVGALGLWQFMPETGKDYVSMNAFWDERGDPLRSSEGAAEYLADLFRRTGDWGIAINSYHSGLGRLLHAEKALGTRDIAAIIHRYDGPGYEFYSRNYFPEFLAVVELYRNRRAYFGLEDGTPGAGLQFDMVKTGDFVNLPELMARFAIAPGAMQSLNPSLKEAVIEGELPLPPYFLLKVPRGLGYYIANFVGIRPAARAQ
ncbi:MAG: lytic transglycosylase domain-containing protein [Deltaproteobacteria bacterium]|nr:lytic transglycosylase domain-containing protein [Deltaproteobacteria bacterium]